METITRWKSLVIQLVALGLIVAAYLVWANMEVVRSAEGAFDFDVDDPRRFFGFSDAVFVGRVVETGGSSVPAGHPFPRTQFRVQVLQDIKSVRRPEGEQINSLPSEPTMLPGSVVVDQYGGYGRDSTGKQVLWLMNGVPLLEPDKNVSWRRDTTGRTIGTTWRRP